MLYGSVADANLRLSGTIIRLKKEPIYVEKFYEDGSFAYRLLNKMNKSLGRVDELEGQLDLTPVPLGYCNSNKTSHYLARIPNRRVKQGTCDENVVCKPGHRILSFNFKSLHNMIQGNYPTLDAILLKFQEDPELSQMAFSRRFAVYRIGDSRVLMYKGYDVGTILPNREINLYDGYKYLTELLNKSLNRSSSYA